MRPPFVLVILCGHILVRQHIRIEAAYCQLHTHSESRFKSVLTVIEKLILLAKFFDVSTDYLLGLRDEP